MSSKTSVTTYLTATLLLCMLVPTVLIGGIAYWFTSNLILENRVIDVGQVADARYENLRRRLHRDEERGKNLLGILAATCRQSDLGINLCAKRHLEQFATINGALGITFHSGIENDLALGAEAIPFDDLKKTFKPGQIAGTFTSKADGASLFYLVASEPTSGFSLAVTYPTSTLQDIFVGSPALGKSGETFLVDKSGFFITKARHPSEQGLTRPISAAPMARCLRGENYETLDSDYRTTPVIHGFRFVPEIGGGCIMAHIDQAEAFEPLQRLAMGLSAAAALFVVVAWSGAAIIGRSLGKPIVMLTDMARALYEGDFTRRVPTARYAEIDVLSQLFNSIAEKLDDTIRRLKKSEQDLERKVVERSAELERRQRKYYEVIRAAGEGFWRVDMAGHILEANAAYLRASGYSEEELVRLAVTDVDTQHTPEDVAERMRKIMLHGSDTFETQHRRKDGGVWDAEINVSFVKEDGGYFVGFIRDISERKRIKKILLEQSQKLVEADRRKDEFLAMLAHELRNPLAPIRNAVYILKHGGSDLGQLAWCSNLIDRQVEHLIRLVDDLLDVSRISRGRIELKNEPLAVRDFVQQAVETSRPLIDARRQAFSVAFPAEPLWVEGDLVRLAQVVSNLLNNAAKYTEEGGRIALTVEADGDDVCIRVCDTGCGIEPSALSSLFDLFYQSERNLDRSQGGLGIGLCLVKRLVEMHGGTVQAYSAGQGHGSEFVVRLPRLVFPQAANALAAPPPSPIHGELRVLVVDDNRDAADSLAVLLQAAGHQVRIAYDGPTAVQLAQTESPDLVLLDIGLPGMDGYAVARKLRQCPELTHVALIALTGYGQPEDREHSRTAGFDGHLVKPVDLGALETLLEKCQATTHTKTA